MSMEYTNKIITRKETICRYRLSTIRTRASAVFWFVNLIGLDGVEVKSVDLFTGDHRFGEGHNHLSISQFHHNDRMAEMLIDYDPDNISAQMEYQGKRFTIGIDLESFGIFTIISKQEETDRETEEMIGSLMDQACLLTEADR